MINALSIWYFRICCPLLHWPGGGTKRLCPQTRSIFRSVYDFSDQLDSGFVSYLVQETSNRSQLPCSTWRPGLSPGYHVCSFLPLPWYASQLECTSLSYGDGILQEIVFGWPFSELERQAYSVQAHRVLQAVGLTQIPVATPLQQLSGGYKRRVALAVQLVRRPAVSSLYCCKLSPAPVLLFALLSALSDMLCMLFCCQLSHTPCIVGCVAVSTCIHMFFCRHLCMFL